MQAMQKLARGHRFRPSDEILVGEFLYKKLTGTMPKSYEYFVMDCDLYNKEEEPWQVWERFRDKDNYYEEDLYFFTPLKKKSTNRNGSRIDRTTGSSGGCWHGEDSGSRIDADGYIKEDYMAMKKRFSYRNRGSKQNGLWIMHEYSLELGQNKSSWVLCRLRKNGDVLTAEGIASGKRKRKSFAKTMVTNNPAVDFGNNENHQSEKRRRFQTETEIVAGQEGLESHSPCYQIEPRLRVDQEQSRSSLTVINNEYSDGYRDSTDIIHHQIDFGLRVEQEEPNLQIFPDLDDNNGCLSSGIIHHQTEACWRVEREELKPNRAPEATEDGPDEEVGLCDPGAEFLNELLLDYDFSRDYFPDFTRGLISIEKFLDVPCDSEKTEPCNQEIEAGMGVAQVPNVQIHQGMDSKEAYDEVQGQILPRKIEKADSLSSFIQMPGQLEEDDMPALIEEDDSPSCWYEALFPNEDLTKMPGQLEEDDVPALIEEDDSPSRWYEALFPNEDLKKMPGQLEEDDMPALIEEDDNPSCWYEALFPNEDLTKMPGQLEEDDKPALVEEDDSPSRWYEALFPNEDPTKGS